MRAKSTGERHKTLHTVLPGLGRICAASDGKRVQASVTALDVVL